VKKKRKAAYLKKYSRRPVKTPPPQEKKEKRGKKREMRPGGLKEKGKKVDQKNGRCDGKKKVLREKIKKGRNSAPACTWEKEKKRPDRRRLIEEKEKSAESYLNLS